MVWFGLLQRTQASENSHPDHQVSATTAKTRPQLVASYYKLPLSFEANKGQTDARVHFLARGGGYTIFLAGDEAVLTLRKSSPSVSRLGKFGPPGRLEPFGLDDPHPVRWPSIGGYLKSLWRSLIPDLSQMVPDPNAGKRGVAGGPEAQPPQVVRMRLLGGNAKGRVVGLDELPGRSNYICGNDPKKWRTSVPSYAQVKFEGVYSGVDLVYYGSQRQLEYDFVVAPGANPDQIKLSFTGADGMRVDAASGDLVLKVGDDEVRFQKPAVYQSAVAPVFGTAGWEPDADLKVRSTLGEPNPEPRIPNPDALSGAFVLASNNEVAFRVAGYDPRRALVIDPVLSYSTYLGGSGGDQGDGIAVDTAGNAYVTGYTMSTDFPTANPLQTNCDNCQAGSSGDAFVAKLNPSGSALVYSTYLGGSDYDVPYGIAVNTAGNAYVTGWTGSTDFPTANPLQASIKGVRNAFVTELNAGGSALLYSTYLGGSDNDVAYGIAVDTAGNAYVTGYTMSTDFPTANPLQGTCGSCNGFYTAFVAKLNPTGSALVYSTYLGGSGGDQGDGIAVDTAGNAYVTGWTASTDFPTANPLQTKCDNCQAGSSGDAFVAKISPGPAEVTLSTNTLTFASYSAGTTSAEESVTLTSSGAGLLTLTSITASGDFALITTGTSCPYTGGSVASSATCTIDVTFTPTTTGLRTGSVTINDNASNTPQVVSLSGTGTAPGVSLSTTSVSFGNQAVGTTSASRAVTVTNNGTASLTFTGIAATGDFTVAASGTTCSSSAPVAASSNCVINVLFTPTATGSRSGSLTLTDNASGTPQTVSLSGTGTGPVVSLSARLTFSAQLVGTTSSSQAVTLTNTGNASLTFTAIAVTAPFAIATSGTTCSTSSPVAAAATCTVAVTFMPTVAGSASGTLSFSDDAPNTPQTIALTGTGQDFSFAPPSGSSTSATVAPGSPATYTLSVGGEAGLSGTVNFTCTGAPSGAICSVSPNPLTVGSSATNVTVTVTTTAPSVSAPRSRPLPPAPPLSPGLRSLLMVALVLTAMAWAIGRRNQPGVGRWRSTRVPLAVGLLLTLALAGCGGGGGGGSGPSNPGTTPGGYILTVTGSTGSGSSTLSHSVTLTLTVS